MIDNVSLQALRAYQNQSTAQILQQNQFANMVEANFNSFASMTPQEIVNYIKPNPPRRIDRGDAISSSIRALKGALQKHETTSVKSLTDDASIIEVVTAASEAKNTLNLLVNVRDKMHEAFEKIFSMPI